MIIDPLVLVQPGLPHEWEIPIEFKQRFFGERLIYTIEELQWMGRLQTARWFLVRNEMGLRCAVGPKSCGAVHPYISLGCVEQPWNSLNDLLLLEERMSEQRGQVHGENLRITERQIIAKHRGAIEPILRLEDVYKLIRRMKAKGAIDAKEERWYMSQLVISGFDPHRR